MVHVALRKNLSPGRYASGMIVCHGDNIKYSFTTCYVLQTKEWLLKSLQPLSTSSFFFDFFSTLKFSFLSELRTVKSSNCPFWRICFAAVCIESGLADLKTWMVQKSSWMTWRATLQFHGILRSVWSHAKCPHFWSFTSPIFPEDDDEIEILSYSKDRGSRSTPPWCWKIRSVDRSLSYLGGQDVDGPLKFSIDSWESKGTPTMPTPERNKALLRDEPPALGLIKALSPGCVALGGSPEIPMIPKNDGLENESSFQIWLLYMYLC